MKEDKQCTRMEDLSGILCLPEDRHCDLQYSYLSTMLMEPSLEKSVKSLKALEVKQWWREFQEWLSFQKQPTTAPEIKIDCGPIVGAGCQPLNFFEKIAEVIDVEFVSTEVWVVTGKDLFKGKKSSFIYSRSRTPWDLLKLQELGHEGRRGRWISACGSLCSSVTVREIHALGVFLILLSSFQVMISPSVNVLSQLEGGFPPLLVCVVWLGSTWGLGYGIS
ncbi:hypothetical protein L484_013412 [Morus notabilis]|uniref:Uncharacterized protein n=1 Tax=Morus notabilis TaxID=981085 RepID=W9RKY3_9ROSA|nr:hypothetical protein L484_013412 [Morus notabilis]